MKKIYLVLFVILSVFVFSCKDNLISDDLSSNQNSGVGQVKVFVKQSRLIGPELSDVSWDVKLQKSGENNTISGKNENGYYLFSGLSDGTYTITVFGKIDEVEKFTGSAQVTIANGNSVSVNVPIVAKKTDKDGNGDGAEKKGYATITMDMSGKLLSLLNSMGSNAYFSSVLVAGDNDPYYIAFLVESESSTTGYESIKIRDNISVGFMDVSGSANIPTGYYYLTFSGLEEFGYAIKLKDNLVEIGDRLTTNIVLTQNDYELVEVLSESQIFYVDNSDNQSDDSYTFGTTLSTPLGFRNINDNTSDGDILYLITDVNTYVNTESSISYISGKTITSFGTDIFNIINNNENFSLKFEGTFLKNIKLTNTTVNGFILLQCPIDGKVILDTPIVQDSNTDSTVLMSKSSNLEIGQNFSGELGIRLSPENWQLGDTVVTFENGVKPSNSNFYISEYADMPSGFASMFYIDDKGKLAQYDASTQWVNFAWDDECPYLITQTQAKNKTYTSIIDNYGYPLYDFNGISTYDEENQTWYFICKDESGNKIPYVVTRPDIHTSTVVASVLPVDVEVSYDFQAMAYDNGKLYFVTKGDSGYGFRFWDFTSDYSTLITESFSFQIENATISEITAFSVKGNDFYIATTLTDNIQQNVSTTHSAIWKCVLTEDSGGYTLSPENAVPYYLTQNDKPLTITDDLSSYSNLPAPTFRVTDLYSEGTSVYGLLANYIETNGRNANGNVYMRGSVFKLQENSTSANATHYGLRKDSLQISDITTAKQYFILPRKIVGIMNKKLIIADDGMIPDKNDCNLDRFILFDLDGSISEKIDVDVSFTTSGSTSGFATNTLF